MDKGLWHCTGGSNQDHPLERKYKKTKQLSEKALQIAEKKEMQKAKDKRKDIAIWMQISKE